MFRNPLCVTSQARSAISAATGHSSCLLLLVHRIQNNIPVANAVANVALKGGNVVSWGNSFVKASSKVASPVAKISVKDAIATAEEFFDGKVRSSVAPKLEYYAVDSGAVVLTHVLQLQLENSIVEAFINADTGKVEGIIDFTANLTYDVIPVTEGSPLDGFKTLVDPEDIIASPEGWDTWNGTRTHVTRGNAVFGQPHLSLFWGGG